MPNGGKQYPHECEECGKDFLGLKDQRFCSRSCSAKVSYRKRLETEGPLRQKTGREVECEICGTKFYAKKHYLDKGQGRFCSRNCADAWNARNSAVISCEECGDEFRVRPNRATVARYCSRKCTVRARSTAAMDRTHNGRRVRKRSSGYIMAWQPDRPESEPYGGWAFEHRLVMEKKLGRRLTDNESVHHLNRDKTDNRPENLVVMSRSAHSKLTNEYRRRKKRKSEQEIDRMKAVLAEHEKRFGPLKGE